MAQSKLDECKALIEAMRDRKEKQKKEEWEFTANVSSVILPPGKYVLGDVMMLRDDIYHDVWGGQVKALFANNFTNDAFFIMAGQSDYEGGFSFIKGAVFASRSLIDADNEPPQKTFKFTDAVKIKVRKDKISIYSPPDNLVLRLEANKLEVKAQTGLIVIVEDGVHLYDGAWTQLQVESGRQMWSGAAGATLNGQVYLAGGYGDHIRHADVVRFDVSTGTWDDVAPMAEARYFAAAACLNNEMYVAGGHTDRLGSNYGDSSVERYSPASNSWHHVPDMKSGRWGHQLVAMDGALYALGGAGMGEKSCERFDPATNKWTATKMAKMKKPRRLFGAAVMGGALYIVGGEGHEYAELRSCERYDPKTNKWETIAMLPEARKGPALACLHGSLYVIGGEGPRPDGGGHPSRPPPLRYDVATNKWVVVQLDEPGLHFGVGDAWSVL